MNKRRKFPFCLFVGCAALASILPMPDGKSVIHPPEVILADGLAFKIRPEPRQVDVFQKQPEVYCGVTLC
jgi:hypothetical protein